MIDQDWPEGYDLTSFLHGDKTAAELRKETKPMTHDYKYENTNEEDRNALIPAFRSDRTEQEQRTQHTPGPWHVSTRDEIVTAGRARCICKVYTLRSQHAPDGEEPIANARLIAAAPDLLAACKLALPYMPAQGYHASIVRATIAAAEGQ